ncbi:MAG: hypothetical protein KF764_03075 [Labilithrix sp.]|nr:hypothetical protein [Labilithrix sp.]
MFCVYHERRRTEADREAERRADRRIAVRDRLRKLDVLEPDEDLPGAEAEPIPVRNALYVCDWEDIRMRLAQTIMGQPDLRKLSVTTDAELRETFFPPGVTGGDSKALREFVRRYPLLICRIGRYPGGNVAVTSCVETMIEERPNARFVTILISESHHPWDQKHKVFSPTIAKLLTNRKYTVGALT